MKPLLLLVAAAVAMNTGCAGNRMLRGVGGGSGASHVIRSQSAPRPPITRTAHHVGEWPRGLLSARKKASSDGPVCDGPSCNEPSCNEPSSNDCCAGPVYNYAPSPPPSGQVAYPYYTVRGPRDFLQANPPSIGPY